MKKSPFLLALALLCMNTTAPSLAQDTDDPYLWLEDVEGEKALEWVESRNKATLDRLDAKTYDELYARNLEILNSDERIAYPSIQGDYLYNFWQDDEHKRGILRRTTIESYLTDNPEWEVVLDIDRLAADEGVNWAYGGSSCLPPEYTSCLIHLSRGGADAAEIREFDMNTRSFVKGGFFLPEAKSSAAWVDANTLLVSTDEGEGSLTTSGYPRIVRLWKRGTPLDSADLVYEAQPSDMGVWAYSTYNDGRLVSLIAHRINFYEGSYHIFNDGKLSTLDLPLDADPTLLGDRLVVYLRSDWNVGDATYPQGSLIATALEDFISGNRSFEVVVAPSERQTIEGFYTTKDYLLVSMLDNVRGALYRYRNEDGRWTGERIPAPDFGNLSVTSTSEGSNSFFFTYSSFVQPTTLYLADESGAVVPVKHLPALFDAAGLAVEQFEATSADGTKIPYFVVHREGDTLDGSNPALLYGYGGFQISMTPSYSPIVGKDWLERGGVYVVANIRGGGEFGPAWHRAALKENRQRAFDDFIAVAEDLIARKITSPEHLGIIGGSNGGLLVGVALTQRPDLFGAVVSTVPLLDMRRYNKLLAGASWMAEYGNPDVPEEWAYISRYSPYQNVSKDRKYPPVLFSTTTRDDRVHPGHARKMAAKMEEMGHPVFYYENTEGGHGTGTTAEQQARMWAVIYTFLLQQLG